MDSILTTIKKLLGYREEFEDFDVDIIVSINTALNALTQNGVGPKEGFKITGKEETWEEFLGDNPRLESAKDYVYIKTKLMFDSTQMSASLIEKYNQIADEIEWRLNVEKDSSDFFKEDDEDKGGE